MPNTAELSVTAPESLEVEDQQITKSPEGRKRRIATGLGLVALSVSAHFAEKYKVMFDWPTIPRLIGQSMQHPALGYLGAWIATKAPRKHKILAAFAAGTAADFVAEAGQAVIPDPDRDPFEFLAKASQLETLKDYGAAMLGMGFFLLQNRQKHDRNVTS